MDNTTLSHSASTGSSHHEVHLCHRCNWPFPNPHPSSRHRRAHKRVCGTVKGYELDQSHAPLSDDSDENTNNEQPSPVFGKTHSNDNTNNEQPSSVVEKTPSDDAKEVVSARSIDGVGKFSRARSEEDVFSDAITEFSDSGVTSPQTENADHKTIEGDFSGSSKLNVVDDSVDKTDTFESGAMVNAMDHFEGVALATDAKLEPLSVGHSNGLQSDTDGVDNVNELVGDKGTEEVLIKAKEDTATQKEEKDLDFSTLGCEEEKLLTPDLDAAERKDSAPILEAERKELVADVVKHDSSGQIDTFEEIEAAKEVKTEVSDSFECSIVVPVDSFIEKEGDSGSFDTNEEESISDKQVKTECLNGGNGNGEVAKEVQEKNAAAVQSDHPTETPSDLYSNAEILEGGLKLESRDNVIEIPTREMESVTPCDTQVKNDVKEVESVTVAGTGPKLNHIGDLSESNIIPEQNDSEILTKSFDNEKKCANEGAISIELNHDKNLEVVDKIQQESSLGECLKENLPSSEEHTDENFTFTPVLDKSTASPVNFQVVHESSTSDVSGECKSVQDEGGDFIVIKENEGISQSTTKAISGDPQTTLTEDKSEINSQEPKPTTDKTEDFEPPSFMTLVNHASEIETVQQATQHPKTDALQAGWFPSLTNVVNESEGRKKNEEKIAKVTQHTPLKNLLVEAKSPNAKQIPSVIQKEEDSAKENGADVMKVNSAVEVKEMDKEWDSPAKYPIESKEKKKKRGFWMPFACCSSSVHRDLQ